MAFGHIYTTHEWDDVRVVESWPGDFSGAGRALDNVREYVIAHLCYKDNGREQCQFYNSVAAEQRLFPCLPRVDEEAGFESTCEQPLICTHYKLNETNKHLQEIFERFGF